MESSRLGGLYRSLLEARVSLKDVAGGLQRVCEILSRVEGYERVRIVRQPSAVVGDAGRGTPPPFFWESHALGGHAVLVDNLAQGGESFGEWASAALFPLKAQGRVWGTLSLYSRTTGFFVPEECALLQEFGKDLESGPQAGGLEGWEGDRFLTDLANLVPGMFYKLRLDSRGLQFLYVSPGIDLLIPLSPAQVQSDAGVVFRALHPADRRKFIRTGIRSRDFLTVFSLEFRLLRPNGTMVWVLATAFPQKQAGAVVWTGLAIDVTPQNKLQEALQREQELLAVVLNNIGDGVIAVDGQGKPMLINQAASRLLGPDLNDLPWDAEEQFRPWFRRRADGTVLHLEAHASDLADLSQHPRGRVLLLRDMTDRDRIEGRLRQSEKLESIGLLAGGIAHDFNNLLTGVFGFIQLARMNADEPERVVSYLDHALEPFQRARTLTQQLLTFAKGGEIDKVTLRVSDLLPPILQFVLGDSPVTWEISAPETPWTVEANEAQLHQVFEALFENARQAMPQGGRLKVGLKNLSDPGSEDRGLKSGPYLEVTVEDAGAGIAPEILPKIFDPFFTTKSGGTGLGLSICFSVVKKHGGTIEAENTSGGALFRLLLPASLSASAT